MAFTQILLFHTVLEMQNVNIFDIPGMRYPVSLDVPSLEEFKARLEGTLSNLT